MGDLKTAKFNLICLKTNPSVALMCATAASMMISIHKKKQKKRKNKLNSVHSQDRGRCDTKCKNIQAPLRHGKKKKKKEETHANTVRRLFFMYFRQLGRLVKWLERQPWNWEVTD